MSKDEELVLLGGGDLGSTVGNKGVDDGDGGGGDTTAGKGDGVVGVLTREGDVGELGVVGGEVVLVRVDVQTVRVEVVAALNGDRNGVEEGLDQGEEIGGLGLELVGTFVGKIDGGEGIRAGAEVSGLASTVDLGVESGGHERLEGGVVTVLAGVGDVADTEHEEADGEVEGNGDVGEGGGGGGGDGEGLELLDLLDEVLAVGAAHLLTLLVGDGDVVDDVADVGEVEVGEVVDPGGVEALDDVACLGVVLGDEELGKSAELDGSLDLVVGKGGHGEGLVLSLVVGVITGVEPGEGNVEGPGGEGQGVTGDGADTGEGTVKLGNIANHVSVALSLGGGDGESGPEVEVVAGELMHGDLVGGQASTVDESVADLGGPADTEVGSTSGASGNSVNGDGGEGATEPSVPGVVRGTGVSPGSLLTKVSSAGLGEGNGGLSAGGDAVLELGHVSDGVGTGAVQLSGDGRREGSEINERSRGGVLTELNHFILCKKKKF